MKIVRSKTTFQVFYLFNDKDDIRIDQYGLWAPKFRALDMKPDTHEIVEHVSNPDVWVAAALMYDTEWSIYDQEQYDVGYDVVLQEEIEAKNKQIHDIRIAKTYSDVTVQFPDGSYGDIQFRNDFDRQNVSNLALGALAEAVSQNPNKKIKFRDKNNKIHNIKAKDMVGLALGVMDKKQGIVEVSWAHKDTLKAMDNLEDVRKYNIHEGWPS